MYFYYIFTEFSSQLNLNYQVLNYHPENIHQIQGLHIPPEGHLRIISGHYFAVQEGLQLHYLRYNNEIAVVAVNGLAVAVITELQWQNFYMTYLVHCVQHNIPIPNSA